MRDSFERRRPFGFAATCNLLHTYDEARHQMKRLFRAAFVTAVAVLLIGNSGRGDSPNNAEATVDKAVQALGGEATLKSIKAYSWKTKGKINIGGNESNFTGSTTVDGLNRLSQAFEGEFNGEKVKGLTVVDGDKGWRKFGEMAMELDKEALANAKRSMYLAGWQPRATRSSLGGEGLQDQGRCGRKSRRQQDAACIEVTGPDGKDFKLYFDKATGLPVKEVARVVGLSGEELSQESYYKDFKAFDGFKTANKVELKHDGEKFLTFEASDFKKLENVDPKTFANPL